MENSFFNTRRGKTASQIIAEAKASISQDTNGTLSKKASGSEPQIRQRLLSTDRPFTPRVTDRNLIDRNSRTIINNAILQRKNGIIDEEELEDGLAVQSSKVLSLNQYSTTNFKRHETLLKRSNSAGAKLPMIINGPSNGICTSRIGSCSSGSRNQFRPKQDYLVSSSSSSSSARPKSVSRIRTGSEVDPIATHIFQLQISQDDVATAQALEQVCDYCVEDIYEHKKELVPIISRHLSSDNARILFPLAELLLLLSRPHGSRTLMILATKVIFKLARDDLNDQLFTTRRTLELLLTGLGNTCPKKDFEAFVYAYGGLKFLTLNGQIAQILSESLGFLHLSVLHMKLLCEDNNETSTHQVMFQVSLRLVLSTNFVHQ